MRLQGFRARWLQLLAIFALAVFYWFCLASHVQEGDTGELVTNAWRLGVSHPPGYPLFTWLHAAFQRLVPVGSVYWRSSFLTSLMALGCVGLVMEVAGAFSTGLLLALSLASSYVFWRLAILPDVFMLNAVFVSLIAYFYVHALTAEVIGEKPASEPASRASSSAASRASSSAASRASSSAASRASNPASVRAAFIFGLAFSNHLTVLFLLPLLVHLAIRERKNSRFYLAGLMGVLAAAGLYLTILCLHSELPSSWGQVTDVGRLVDHFLRKDYGTFQLSAVGTEDTWAANLGQIFQILSSDLGAVFLALCGLGYLGYRKAHWPPAMLGLLGTAIFYFLVFFKIGNLPPKGFNTVVVDRFYLQGLILLVFAAAAGARELITADDLRPRAREFIVILVASGFFALNVFCYWDANSKRGNSVIEDVAMNLLRMADLKKTIIFTQSDTETFAIEYCKDVLGFHPEVLSFTPTSVRWDWRREQLRRSRFHLAVSAPASNLNEEQTNDFVLKAALDSAPVLVSSGYADKSAQYHLRFLGIGRVLSKGSGIDFDPESLKQIERRQVVDVAPPPPPWREDIAIYTQYGHYHFARAMDEADHGRFQEAEASLELALKEVPFFISAQEKICVVQQKLGKPGGECMQKLMEMRASAAESYSYF